MRARLRTNIHHILSSTTRTYLSSVPPCLSSQSAFSSSRRSTVAAAGGARRISYKFDKSYYHLPSSFSFPFPATQQVIDTYITRGSHHGIARRCWVIIVVDVIVIIMAEDAVGPEESVSERAGSVHLRVTQPRWYMPVLVLAGHGFVLLVFGSGRL
jgi:hypothetical protein